MASENNTQADDQTPIYQSRTVLKKTTKFSPTNYV
ncbi:MAG: hypothetical protein RL329_1459 [Bacteroidota bacterium]